ncbi:MAG: PEP-CTERM sorting domain-containing protein [Verrucomicrobiota bacterium]
MKITKITILPMLVMLLTLSASAVDTFTETFNTNDSGWLDGAFGTPTYNAMGGVGNTGYISYTNTFTSGTGMFGSDPTYLAFRGNNTSDASSDAFVGDWISDQIESFSIAVRHNHTTALNFYARIASFGGAGASLANNSIYSVDPNVWTTITFDIEDNAPLPPFVSYGSSDFNGVFSNIQDIQLGYYVPASTNFTGLTVDVDNVGVTAVPEPSTFGLLLLGAAGLLLRRRR